MIDSDSVGADQSQLTSTERAIARLERESGCCGLLNWRLDLDPETEWVGYADNLRSRGWSLVCDQPFLLVGRRSDGHEVAIVPVTGRVQIRVYRLVEKQKREATAQLLARQLLAARSGLESD